MPKRPPSKKKAAKRKKQSRGMLLPISIWLLLIATMAGVFYFTFLHQNKTKKFTKTDDAIYQELPHFEEPDTAVTIVEPPKNKPIPPVRKKISLPPATSSQKLPLIAIVIDDMGYRKKVGEQLLDLDLNLSFAFLPYGPHTATQAHDAGLLGRDVLLHLPMEPTSTRWDPGPGALLLSMNTQSMRDRFKRDLAAVPMATGVNNHMGSRFTQNRDAMADLLEIVRQNDLFFLDSMTSHSSVGYYMAQEMGIKSAKRNVFLDNERHKAKIKRQLKALVKLARKKGWAIGIGHPYEETLAALAEYRSTLKRKAKIVSVHQLMH